MLAFLGTVLRESLLVADAKSRSVPVFNIQGLVDSALQDGGPMHRFFQSLASSRSGADGPPSEWDTDDRSTCRTTLGVLVSLKIMRKLNCHTRLGNQQNNDVSLEPLEPTEAGTSSNVLSFLDARV